MGDRIEDNGFIWDLSSFLAVDVEQYILEDLYEHYAREKLKDFLPERRAFIGNPIRPINFLQKAFNESEWAQQDWVRIEIEGLLEN